MKFFIASLFLLALLVACGDESSSSVSPEPGDDSSSSVIPASSNDDQSSSSQRNSGKEKSSSSIEEKSSSSVSDKNSSSSVVESSSSFELEPVCDDGDTTTVEAFGEYIYETCRDGFWEADSTKSKRVVDSLAAIEKNKEHPNLDSLFAGYSGEYLEFEDPRDGHKYKYIKFKGYTDDAGSNASFYVMAENLNYGKMVPLGTAEFNDAVTEKLCYENDEWFCDNHFGGLYSWAEAMNLPKVCDSVEVSSNDACKAYADSARNSEKMRTIVWQGICPDGWHIMNQREWTYTRGDIRSQILWEKYAGRNASGLAIIPTGDWVKGIGFSGARELFVQWMPNESNEENAKRIFISSISNTFDNKGTSGGKNMFQPVRCVMDDDNPLAKN